MSKKNVVHIRCDRCGRSEFQDAKEENPNDKNGAAFSMRLDFKVLTYEDLCQSCKDSILHIWETYLAEWANPVKHHKFTTPGPAVPQDRAAPSSVAPDYSPPKPHSNNKK